jgi:SAM-dependent methyltransferase
MTHTSYDEIPYATLAQRSTDPNRLAAVGRLYGVEVPSPERAAILEIGCGTGANLLHIAELFPGSRCVGIDISERHIAEGRKIASAAGIRNIELRCGDLQNEVVEGRAFDYVICHGVYSWVPPHVQKQLLHTLSSAVSEHGLVYVSYNVLPGWRQRGAIRDIMMTGALHRSVVSNSYAPEDRLQGAMELLSLVGSVRTSEGDLYGSYVKESLKRFKDSHPAYLFHEYLEEHNSAVLFSDFMREVDLYGLQFLAEAKAPMMSADDLGSEVQEYISRLGEDILTREQCLDILRNRMFRESIMCRGHHTLKRDLKASVFKSLHFVSDYRFVRETSKGVEFSEVTEGRVVTTPRDEHSEALRLIGSVGYGGLSFAVLCDELRQGPIPDLDERMAMHIIVRLWRAGFVDVALQRASIATKVIGVARVSEVARYQAAHEDGPVIALQHRSCRLSALERRIISMSDGQRSFEDILSVVGEGDQSRTGSDAVSRLVELGFFRE